MSSRKDATAQSSTGPLVDRVAFCRHDNETDLNPTKHGKVNDEHAGAVIEALGLRRGELSEMAPVGGPGGAGRQRLAFEVPARGMIGFR
jgi:GTP-binding protein